MFSETIDEMSVIICEYEEKRGNLLKKFKDDMGVVINRFHTEKLETNVLSLSRNTEEGWENWKEVEPRMEAINQIKSIFKSKFAPRRTSN